MQVAAGFTGKEVITKMIKRIQRYAWKTGKYHQKKDKVKNCQGLRGCDAFCCRHVALTIDKPVCKRDYDQLRWYLLHKNIWISIDLDGDWLLEFRTDCINIKGNRCSDYPNRPRICREYPAEDEICERKTEMKPYRKLFTNVKELEDYLDERKVNWRWKGDH